MLRCIRCAACMNHCPVYGAVGGHAYGWVYPGPMGAVLTPSPGRHRQDRAAAQCLHLLRPLRERLPGEDPAAQADAALAGAGVRAAPDARRGPHQPRSSGPGSRGGPALYRWRRGRRSARSGCSAAARARSARCRWPAAGPRAATCRRRRADTFMARYAKRAAALAAACCMTAQEADPRRHPARAEARAAAGGPAGDAGRAARHPSAPPDPCPVAAAAARPGRAVRPNVEKEFGTVERVPALEAVPAAVAEYLAAQNLPSRFVMAPHPEFAGIPWSDPPLLEIRDGPRPGDRPGQRPARLCRRWPRPGR